MFSLLEVHKKEKRAYNCRFLSLSPSFIYAAMYLDEIQRQLETMLMLEVSLSTICRCLHDNGFTRKKLQKEALQQDKFLREQYISDVSVYSRDMIVFVDETGAEK